jgi:COMPASS component SWD1
MNLALIDPFQLAQDHPDTLTNVLRMITCLLDLPPLLTRLGSGHAIALRFSRKGDYLASGRVHQVSLIHLLLASDSITG